MMNLDYTQLTGELITRDNFLYEKERKQWNRAIEKYPLAIIYCNNEEDVSNAVLWARKNKLPIRIRSGRHHYEGYSIGNNVLVIDVSRMNSIFIDEDKGIVKIQGGVRNRELYEATGRRGYPFPGGGCPTVGVVGFTLGGGWGYSSRLLGLGCDSLVEVELINYEGNKIVANNEVNKDLFWALRGSGGGNFGVVVGMTFKLPSKIKNGTLINIDCPINDIDDKVELFYVYQNMFKTLDYRCNFKMAVYNSKEKGKGIKFTGVFYGTKAEANEAIMPIKKMAINISVDMQYMSVPEINEVIQNSHPDYESYKSAGRFINRDYSKEEIRRLIELVSDRAEGSIYTAISLYGLGGRVSESNMNETSFYYRDAKFIVGFQSVWEDSKYAEVNREWTLKRLNEIKKMTTGSFVNFPLGELEDFAKEYYGENANKLKEIRKIYDPHKVFAFEQGL